MSGQMAFDLLVVCVLLALIWQVGGLLKRERERDRVRRNAVAQFRTGMEGELGRAVERNGSPG